MKDFGLPEFTSNIEPMWGKFIAFKPDFGLPCPMGTRSWRIYNGVWMSVGCVEDGCNAGSAIVFLSNRRFVPVVWGCDHPKVMPDREELLAEFVRAHRLFGIKLPRRDEQCT